MINFVPKFPKIFRKNIVDIWIRDFSQRKKYYKRINQPNIVELTKDSIVLEAEGRFRKLPLRYVVINFKEF